MSLAWAVLLLATSPSDAPEESSDPLAELAALGAVVAAAEPETGGSIRAAQALDQTAPDPEWLDAKVTSIKTRRFPLAALTVTVLEPAKSGPGKDAQKNARLVIVPVLKLASGVVDTKDPQTLQNCGAYYLKPGDRVGVKLAKLEGKLWSAAAIERR